MPISWGGKGLECWKGVGRKKRIVEGAGRDIEQQKYETMPRTVQNLAV